jgi:hypothetical protein
VWKQEVTQKLRMQSPILSIRKLSDEDFTDQNIDYELKCIII